MYDMYRLLAIAKYDERYVIPPAHAEQAHALEEIATECSLNYDGGPGMGGSGPFGEGSGAPTPIAVENFAMLQNRQSADTLAGPASKTSRVNLLNWDGKGAPSGLFPPRSDAPAAVDGTAAGLTGGTGVEHSEAETQAGPLGEHSGRNIAEERTGGRTGRRRRAPE